MEELQKDSLKEVGLTAESGQEGCVTVTCESFGDGVEYVGFIVQTIGVTILAIMAVIVFYLVQKGARRKKEGKM